jgi:hypothetical protein
MDRALGKIRPMMVQVLNAQRSKNLSPVEVETRLQFEIGKSNVSDLPYDKFVKFMERCLNELDKRGDLKSTKAIQFQRAYYGGSIRHTAGPKIKSDTVQKIEQSRLTAEIRTKDRFNFKVVASFEKPTKIPDGQQPKTYRRFRRKSYEGVKPGTHVNVHFRYDLTQKSAAVKTKKDFDVGRRKLPEFFNIELELVSLDVVDEKSSDEDIVEEAARIFLGLSLGLSGSSKRVDGEFVPLGTPEIYVLE